MSELSEYQLLLLNNVMYYDKICFDNGATLEGIATSMLRNAPNNSMFSGGISETAARDIAIRVLEEVRGGRMPNLKVASSIDKNSVRAICFVDRDGDATVAIRGTGGSYDAWKDNVMGAVEVTDCQQTIEQYINTLGNCGYSDITITGHSKGGNLSQHATIAQGQYIDRCVSFDGQGFSNDYIKAHSSQIEANSDKITSICGDDDIVNTLLNDSFINKKVYLDVEEGFEQGHSSYELLERGFDREGNMEDPVPQSELARNCDVLADRIVYDLGNCPAWMEKAIVSILGCIVGLVMGKASFAEIIAAITEILLGLGFSMSQINKVCAFLSAELAKMGYYYVSGQAEKDKTARENYDQTRQSNAIASIDNSSRQHMYGSGQISNIDINLGKKNIFGEMSGIAKRTGNMQKTILSICKQIQLESEVDSIIKTRLSNAGDELEKRSERIEKLSSAGERCFEMYEMTEKSICDIL